MDNFIITIARGFGTGGREIASRLADELKIHSYENRILTLASQLSGYDEHYFMEADEKRRDLCQRQGWRDCQNCFSRQIRLHSYPMKGCSNIRNGLLGNWLIRSPVLS
ncbi:MAG: cytidylate kinase family protein [Lacrimispora sp.]